MSENMLGIINNYEEKGKEMTKEELRAKLAEDSKFKLSEDASDTEKKLFAEIKKELASEAKKLELEKKKKAAAKAAKASEAEIEADKKFISKSIHTKEMNELKSRLGVAEKKLQFKEVKEVVSGFVFSESNPNGVLLAKNKDVASKILMSASDKIAKLFKEFLAELPKVSAKLFKEEGGDNTILTSDALLQEATKLMEAGKTYSEAIKQLQSEKPELFE